MKNPLGKRLSSSLTTLYKVMGFGGGTGPIIAGVALWNYSVVLGISCCALGACGLVIWWKYLRTAARVTMDDEGLWVAGKREERIRYSQIISIAQKPGMYQQTVWIKYKQGGAERWISFFPSLETGGWFFTADHIEELITRHLPKMK